MKGMEAFCENSFGFWMYMLLMLTGGKLGGLIAYYFFEDYKSDNATNKVLFALGPFKLKLLMLRRILMGLGAGLVVPLFLDFMNSPLLDTKNIDTNHLIVFFGTCVLVAIFASRFINALSDNLLNKLERDTAEVLANQKQQKTNEQAINAVRLQLDDDLGNDIPREELKKRVIAADDETATEIYFIIKKYYKSNFPRFRNKLSYSIPVIEALIERDKENKYYYNYALLGDTYLYQQKSDPAKAIELLNKAIELRNSDKNDDRTFNSFEFSRAFARVATGQPAPQEVMKDLRYAVTFEGFRKAILSLLSEQDESKVKEIDRAMWKWLRNNEVSKEALGLKEEATAATEEPAIDTGTEADPEEGLG